MQRFRAVRGALLLSTQGGDIDQAVEAERLQIVKLFRSLLGASWWCCRCCSRAPSRARCGGSPTAPSACAAASGRASKFPTSPRRRDEIGDLSGALRDMTNALYSRIEAIESFAADVAHELKNPLTSLRSAVETLPLAKIAGKPRSGCSR